MDASIERIAELERANYAASLAIAQVTPGLEVSMRDDVIIMSSELFPTPDTNNACLFRATPYTVDNLIAEVIDHFRAKGLPAAIFISPACTPADLAERLLSRGFVRQAEEAWLVLDDLLHFRTPAASFPIAVKQITKDEVATFAAVFVAAFEMPVEFAPYMAQILEPWINLPGVYHYIASAGEQPVGTASLICNQHFAILGSTGVIPAHRRSGAATSLVVTAIADAQKQGIDTLMLQTTAGTLLERQLRMSGFKKVFSRTCYTLS